MIESTDFGFSSDFDALCEAMSTPVTVIKVPRRVGMRTYRAGRDPLFTGTVMRHGGSWHDYSVYRVKNGKVTWRCRFCGKCDSKQVRVYGILPADLLFVKRGKHYAEPAMVAVR